MRFTIHIYAWESEEISDWVFLLSYRNHMKLAHPPNAEVKLELLPRPTSVSYFKGRVDLLCEDGQRTLIPTKALTRCPICQETHIRLPPGVQGAMVGKAAIKESHQLRSLLIQDPWAYDSALEISPEAGDEWIAEQSSLPLDLPPRISPENESLVVKLVQSVPTSQSEFTEHEWGKIASMGDELISGIGNLKDAAHCYIDEWGKTRSPTTMTPTGLDIFNGHVGEGLLDYGMRMASHGVGARSHAPPIRPPQEPYPSVRDNSIQSIHDLWPDLVEGRLFIFSVKSESTVGPLMETKLSFVEQKVVGNTNATKIRYICDPRLEINPRTDSRRHPFLFATTIPSLLRGILFWKRRYPGVPILLCMRDVKSAFKIVPLSIRMLYHAGVRIANYLMIYLSMYFGRKGAPGNWGIISSLLVQFLSSHMPKNSFTHGPGSFGAFQFVDDGGFAEPALGLRPWMSVKLWEKGLVESLGFNSLNRDKKRIEGCYQTESMMRGVHIDTVTERVSSPPDKIPKAQVMLPNPLFDAGVTRLPLNLIQQLRGKMEFWSSCCPHIRTECNVIDRILSSKNGYSFPKGNSIQAKRAFAEFWETIEFLRGLLGPSNDVTASFHCSFLNVLYLSEQLSFRETRRNIVWVGSDSTLKRCGAIDFPHKLYTHFSTEAIPRLTGDRVGGDSELIIAIAEFCSFIFFLIMRDKDLINKLVAYTGDNSNVISWLTHRRSGNEWARFLLRILARYEQALEVRVYPLYISTINNVDCDNLTRFSEEDIHIYATERHWAFLGSGKVLEFYPGGPFLRRIPMIHSDNVNRVKYLFQLAEKRTFRPIPKMLETALPIFTVGLGAGCWANIFSDHSELQGTNIPWPSETLFVTPPAQIQLKDLSPHFRINFRTTPHHQDWNFIAEIVKNRLCGCYDIRHSPKIRVNFAIATIITGKFCY